MYDVIILGAGPAGCLAAAGVKRSDPTLKVAIVERDTESKHRVGEALLTGTVYTLYDAGLINVVNNGNWHRKIGASYLWGESKEPWYVGYHQDGLSEDYPSHMQDETSRYTIHVPRHIFDKELLEEVVRVYGIDVINDSITSVEVAGSRNKIVKHVKLKSGNNLEAKYWIDATGQSSVLGRVVTNREPIFSRRHAAYGYYTDVDWNIAESNGYEKNRTNILSNENGWMWLIHLGERGHNLTSIGVVSDKDTIEKVTPETIYELFPHMEKFGLKPNSIAFDYLGETPMKRLYRHPDYSFKCEQLHGANWALCGDAGLFLDPILSQGVTLAVHYGWMRGLAAAQYLNGDDEAQAYVTQHYLNESAVLGEMVGYWYNSNKQASDWKLQANQFVPEDQSVDNPFLWVTNLENIRNEYLVYSDTDQIKINKALNLKEDYLTSKES